MRDSIHIGQPLWRIAVSEPIFPSAHKSRLVTLSIELSNARTDRGGRLRSRTEQHILGVVHGPDVNSFTPPYDPFSFCCYRALLLGVPCAIVRATIQPGGRTLLADPLPPQRLKGEETVEARHWSTRSALLFRLYRPSGNSPRRVFGYRNSDCRPYWWGYDPAAAILDQATRLPPTFADLDDFQRKAQVLAGGKPLTKMQAWSTWFSLLLHTTFYAIKKPVSPDAPNGRYQLEPWIGIQPCDVSLMKAGH
jgi:hypothetical protein